MKRQKSFLFCSIPVGSFLVAEIRCWFPFSPDAWKFLRTGAQPAEVKIFIECFVLQNEQSRFMNSSLVIPRFMIGTTGT